MYDDTTSQMLKCLECCNVKELYASTLRSGKIKNNVLLYYLLIIDIHIYFIIKFIGLTFKRIKNMYNIYVWHNIRVVRQIGNKKL